VITKTVSTLVSQSIDISPDGQKLVFVRNSATINGTPGWDIYTMNINGTKLANLANNATQDTTPMWSPDGTKIMFAAYRAGGIADIWIMNADESDPVRLVRNSFDDRLSDWYRHGQRKTKFDFDGDSKADIAVYRPSTGQWWVVQSTNGITNVTWGNSTDIPIPSAFVRQ